MKWIKMMIGFLPIMDVLKFVLNLVRGWVNDSTNVIDDHIYNAVEYLLESAFATENVQDRKKIIAETILLLFDTLSKETETEIDDNLVEMIRKILSKVLGTQLQIPQIEKR